MYAKITTFDFEEGDASEFNRELIHAETFENLDAQIRSFWSSSIQDGSIKTRGDDGYDLLDASTGKSIDAHLILYKSKLDFENDHLGLKIGQSVQFDFNLKEYRIPLDYYSLDFDQLDDEEIEHWNLGLFQDKQVVESLSSAEDNELFEKIFNLLIGKNV